MVTIHSALKAQMQAAVAGLLTDTCTITREVVSTDEYGAPTNTWAVVATGTACRVIVLSRLNERAGEQGGRETIADTYRLIAPAGTALDTGYRVTVASDGAVYEVVDLVTARTDGPDVQAIITRAR